MDTFFKKIPTILLLFMWGYILLPFSAPIAYVNGNDNLGDNVNRFYEQFCHQRVERSLFLFGEDSELLYSVDELKEFNTIPQESFVDDYPEYFGHGFVGDETVGYKVPLCIRDIALYGVMVLVSTLLMFFKKKVKVPLWVYVLLFSPMVIDGIFQSVVESIRWEAIPISYIQNIPKRVITGAMFGIGFALFVFGSLIEAVSEVNAEYKK